MRKRLSIRQGDVLLVPVDTIPASAAPAPRDAHNRVVLAEGEHHGHAHALRDANVTAFRVETAEDVTVTPELRAMVDYILVGGSTPATLKHEYVDGQKADHDAIVTEPGAYRVVQQREELGDEFAVQAFD